MNYMAPTLAGRIDLETGSIGFGLHVEHRHPVLAGESGKSDDKGAERSTEVSVQQSAQSFCFQAKYKPAK